MIDPWNALGWVFVAAAFGFTGLAVLWVVAQGWLLLVRAALWSLAARKSARTHVRAGQVWLLWLDFGEEVERLDIVDVYTFDNLPMLRYRRNGIAGLMRLEQFKRLQHNRCLALRSEAGAERPGGSP